MKKYFVLFLASIWSVSAWSQCPVGSSWNSSLGFCANATYAYGPFTKAMKDGCAASNSSTTCNRTAAVTVESLALNLPRWSLALANSLRGSGTCPAGSSVNASFGGRCVETVAGNSSLFANISRNEWAKCVTKNGSATCYQSSWPTTLWTSTQSLTLVPYYNQNQNINEPTATCNITSLAMTLDHFQITNPTVIGARTPDYLYSLYGKNGDPVGMANIWNSEAQKANSSRRDNVRLNGTFAELRSLASQNIPTIVHGWFTASGHIMVVTGYDGVYYTVNDPYGKWNLKKYGRYDTTVTGETQRYPKAQFEAVITDTGLGDDLWLHVFE